MKFSVWTARHQPCNCTHLWRMCSGMNICRKTKKIPTSLQRSLVKMSLVLRICFVSKMNVVWTTYKIDHPNTCISIFYQPVIQAFHCSKFFEIRVFKTNLSVVFKETNKEFRVWLPNKMAVKFKRQGVQITIYDLIEQFGYHIYQAWYVYSKSLVMYEAIILPSSCKISYLNM